MLAAGIPVIPYFDLDGSPLDEGYLWFGVENLNPETNPITVYWDLAGTIPAAQPIRTLNGYPVNNGAPAAVFVPTAYSLTTRNLGLSLVTYFASSTSFDANQIFITQIAGANGSSGVGWIQAGTGAKTRNVQDRLRETVSSLDDMTATQIADVLSRAGSVDVGAAITSLFALGQTIEFASGVHYIAANLTIPVGVKFREGTILKPGNGVKITLNGPVTANLSKCFDLSNAGSSIVGTFGGVDPNVEWWGASRSASKATNKTAIGAAVTFVNARYIASKIGGNVLFSDMYPVDPGVIQKDYVHMMPAWGAMSQFNNIAVGDAPRAGFDASTSTTIGFIVDTVAGTRVSNSSIVGLSFWGAGTSISHGGIRILGGGYNNISFNTLRNMGAQAILAGSNVAGQDCQACTFEKNNGILCLLGTGGSRVRAFKSGVLEIHGPDNHVIGGEYNAGNQLAISDPNMNVCAVMLGDVAGGGSEGCIVEGVVCEFADIGLYIAGGKHRIANNRFDTNAGHGFYNASFHTTITGNQAYRNGLDVSGPQYSDYYAEMGTALECQYTGNMSMPINYGGTGGHVAFSFTDLNTGNASKNTYVNNVCGGAVGSFSFPAALVNFAADRGAAWQCLDGAAKDLVGATPDVFNYKNWRTANPGAVSITNFLNGIDGQEITVYMNDSNTTIVNGANISTISGSNIAPGSGKAYRFRFYVGGPGKWIQT